MSQERIGVLADKAALGARRSFGAFLAMFSNMVVAGRVHGSALSAVMSLLALGTPACGGLVEGYPDDRTLSSQADGSEADMVRDAAAPVGTPGEKVTAGESLPYFEESEEPLGVPYPDWLAAYWQWHLSIPKSLHPREGGACAEGQEGEVWFLTTGKNGVVEERVCVIEESTPVFFVFNSGLNFPSPDCSACSQNQRPEAWFSNVETVLDAYVEQIYPNQTYLELNGAVVDLGRGYYWETAEPFYVNAPQSDPYFACTNAFEAESCGWNAGPRPFVAVGFAIMLKPLPAGEHVIRYGALSEDGRWVTDVTYRITVLDEPIE